MNPRVIVVAGSVLSALVLAAPCSASIIVSGSVSATNPESGHLVRGTYDFSVSGTDLIVTIANTSDPLTTNGDVLSGILFKPSIFPMSFDQVEVLSGDTIWTDKSTSNTLGADWTSFWSSTFGVNPPDAGTVGAATTGAGGIFSMSGVAGSEPGSPNYGAVSNGTYPQSGGGPGNPNKFALADNRLVLTFSTGGDSLDGLRISDVELLFGTSGEGRLGHEPTPEPSAIITWGVLFSLGVSLRFGSKMYRSLVG
jgi:hypothetical protein